MVGPLPLVVRLPPESSRRSPAASRRRRTPPSWVTSVAHPTSTNRSRARSRCGTFPTAAWRTASSAPIWCRRCWAGTSCRAPGCGTVPSVTAWSSSAGNRPRADRGGFGGGGCGATTGWKQLLEGDGQRADREDALAEQRNDMPVNAHATRCDRLLKCLLPTCCQSIGGVPSAPGAVSTNSFFHLFDVVRVDVNHECYGSL